MFNPGRVWQEETFKIENSRGRQGSFFVFSIFVFFLAKRKPCRTNFSENTNFRLRSLARASWSCITLLSHLKSNYVIRIGTRQDRYVSMREFRTTRFCRWATRQWRSHQNTYKTFPSRSFSLRFLLNTERSYITSLRCSDCQSEIPTDDQCSNLTGLFPQI